MSKFFPADLPQFPKLRALLRPFTLASLWFCTATVQPLVAADTPGANSVAAAAPSDGPEVFGQVYQCNPGPWGDLEYYYIYLEPPDRVLKELAWPEPTPKWNFPGGTDEKLRALFDKAGISEALQAYLLDPNRRTLEGDVLTVFPPLPDLIAMTPNQRAVIYAELAKSNLNALHAFPICISDGDAATWIAQASLRPELAEAVKKMTYMRGDMLCFSDVSAILGMVQSEEEAYELMKTMSRVRSLVLQLKVKSGPEFRQTLRYWTADHRNERIESMILPALKTQGMERLDCAHLLPPLARRNLYTYPSDELALSARMPDCTWTALNFFSSTPLNYHTDGDLVLHQFTQNYDLVEPPYTFGDVLLLLNSNGVPLHSCVYIADDIMYTKNGGTRASPWILMKMGDLKKLYSYDQQFTTRGYRLKPEQNRARG